MKRKRSNRLKQWSKVLAILLVISLTCFDQSMLQAAEAVSELFWETEEVFESQAPETEHAQETETTVQEAPMTETEQS